MPSRVRQLCARLLCTFSVQEYLKARKELSYWRARMLAEGTLNNAHYEYFFTSHFGLAKEYFDRKTILDIGCGPRGSLEWASQTDQRIGLDPLAHRYLGLGIRGQKMQYVGASSEKIPFPNDHFDVVSSFNSLDHVLDLQGTVNEIIRVTAPGGLFLLLTDVNHTATVCEPLEYSFDIVRRFQPALDLLQEREYEKSAAGMYESILAGVPYDQTCNRPRYGIVSAQFIKPRTDLGRIQL